MTPAQHRALTALWPQYGLEPPVDLDAAFGRRAPRHLEIGFGNGDALLAMAGAHAENDYLGIEVYRPGIGSLLGRAAERGLGNLRVLQADAVEALSHIIPDAALAAVYILFPDPWPKKRHHKRRLIQAPLVALLAKKLALGGRVSIATDWAPYATQVLEVMGASSSFINLAGPNRFAQRPAERPSTRFELRGRRLGHVVHDLIFERCAPGPREIDQ
jgi:tRNA (guanine-N7-)-methyltransferase